MMDSFSPNFKLIVPRTSGLKIEDLILAKVGEKGGLIPSAGNKACLKS